MVITPEPTRLGIRGGGGGGVCSSPSHAKDKNIGDMIIQLYIISEPCASDKKVFLIAQLRDWKFVSPIFYRLNYLKLMVIALGGGGRERRSFIVF